MDQDYDEDAFQVPESGRVLNIEFGGSEVVSIDLENLDPDPIDIIEVLKEANSNVWVWTRVAGEYWRNGLKNGTGTIIRTAKSCRCDLHSCLKLSNVLLVLSDKPSSSKWPLHAFEANTVLSEARTAPKVILPTASKQ